MINNIQILRGLAALWVVFHHSLGHFKAMDLTFAPFEWLAAYGFAGVDVFFVISGLVMAKTTEHLKPGRETAQIFLGKRFARIYLGYWPILLLTAVVVWSLHPEIFTDKNIIGSILLTSINMFELIIPQSWSLPFELYFYFLVALILWLQINNVNKFFLTLSIFIVIKLLLLDFGISYTIDLLFSHMIFEFMFGYYFWLFRDKLLKLTGIFWLFLAVVTFGIGAYFELVGTVWRIATFGLFSLSIVAMAVKYESKLWQTVVNILKPIGDASYTLYLLHFVMFFIFYQTGLRDFLVEHDIASVGFVAYLLLIVMLSIVLYRLLEKPLYLSVSKKITHS